MKFFRRSKEEQATITNDELKTDVGLMAQVVAGQLTAGAHAGIDSLTQAAAAALDTNPLSGVTPEYDAMLEYQVYKDAQILETIDLVALVRAFQQSVQQDPEGLKRYIASLKK